MAPSKSIHMVDSQQQILLDYMVAHPDFSRGKFLDVSGREKSKSMWQVLAARLNSQGGGCTKDASKWQEAWKSWKRHTKAKALKVRVYMNGTGGGPPSNLSLTPREEKLLELMGGQFVYGMPDIPDLGVRNEENPPALQEPFHGEERVQLDDAIFFFEDIVVDSIPLETILVEDPPSTPTMLRANSASKKTYAINEGASTSGGCCSAKRKAPAASKTSTPKRSRVEGNSYTTATDKFASLDELNRMVAESQAATIASFRPILERMEGSLAVIAQAVSENSRNQAAQAKSMSEIAEALAKLVEKITK